MLRSVSLFKIRQKILFRVFYELPYEFKIKELISTIIWVRGLERSLCPGATRAFWVRIGTTAQFLGDCLKSCGISARTRLSYERFVIILRLIKQLTGAWGTHTIIHRYNSSNVHSSLICKRVVTIINFNYVVRTTCFVEFKIKKLTSTVMWVRGLERSLCPGATRTPWVRTVISAQFLSDFSKSCGISART